MLKKKKNLKELFDCDTSDLIAKRLEARKFLMQARILLSQGSRELKTHLIREKKRFIARINTVLSEKRKREI